jgi:hypothetical protein
MRKLFTQNNFPTHQNGQESVLCNNDIFALVTLLQRKMSGGNRPLDKCGRTHPRKDLGLTLSRGTILSILL